VKSEARRVLMHGRFLVFRSQLCAIDIIHNVPLRETSMFTSTADIRVAEAGSTRVRLPCHLSLHPSFHFRLIHHVAPSWTFSRWRWVHKS
jgi:hypothetical protein